MQENGGTFGGRYGRGGRPAEVGSAGPATPATVDKHLAARAATRAQEMQHTFGRKLAKVMGQPQFMAPAVAALLPDPATARGSRRTPGLKKNRKNSTRKNSTRIQPERIQQEFQQGPAGVELPANVGNDQKKMGLPRPP